MMIPLNMVDELAYNQLLKSNKDYVMLQPIHLQEASTHLDELVEAALRGETVIIVNENAQTVQLVPTDSNKKKRKLGTAKGLITIADDFDDPLPDFDEYM